MTSSGHEKDVGGGGGGGGGGGWAQLQKDVGVCVFSDCMHLIDHVFISKMHLTHEYDMCQ